MRVKHREWIRRSSGLGLYRIKWDRISDRAVGLSMRVVPRVIEQKISRPGMQLIAFRDFFIPFSKRQFRNAPKKGEKT